MKRMKQAIVYLKAEKSSKITREKVYLGDVCNIICTEPELEQKLKAVLIYDFGKNKNQTELSLVY